MRALFPLLALSVAGFLGLSAAGDERPKPATPEVKYVYVPEPIDEPLYVELMRKRAVSEAKNPGDWEIWAGYLDAEGNFIPQRGARPRLYSDGLGHHNLINEIMTDKETEPVYEYRSRFLIPGVLDKDSNFVPEKGGRISRFRDYQYSKTARRIYNLPGEFVPDDGELP